MGIAYKDTMVSFINWLNSKGYNVVLIANAARINSEKSRNNDLMVGDAIYADVADKDKVRWYHKEMDAEEIRAYIGKCRFLVASRFHAMIGSLEQKVPVLLIGWSHKYQEVLDMFELGQYAIDFSKLELSELEKSFNDFVSAEDDIRKKLDKNLDSVLASSRNNIKYISEIIDEIMAKPYKKAKLLDFKNPDKYIGPHIGCKKGYGTNEGIRANAASGGMVTSLLCNLLKHGDIDGAWVTKTDFVNGELSYKTYVATTEEEIRDASSSVYMTIPLLKHIDVIKNYIAVVPTHQKLLLFPWRSQAFHLRMLPVFITDVDIGVVPQVLYTKTAAKSSFHIQKLFVLTKMPTFLKKTVVCTVRITMLIPVI